MEIRACVSVDDLDKAIAFYGRALGQHFSNESSPVPPDAANREVDAVAVVYEHPGIPSFSRVPRSVANDAHIEQQKNRSTSLSALSLIQRLPQTVPWLAGRAPAEEFDFDDSVRSLSGTEISIASFSKQMRNVLFAGTPQVVSRHRLIQQIMQRLLSTDGAQSLLTLWVGQPSAETGG